VCCARFYAALFNFVEGFAVSSFYGFAVSEFGLEGSKAKRLECLPPSLRPLRPLKTLRHVGATAFSLAVRLLAFC